MERGERKEREERFRFIGRRNNSTFMRLNDLMALERQCQWPSCRIPIRGVICNSPDERRDKEGSLWSPGPSDYCVNTSACHSVWGWPADDKEQKHTARQGWNQRPQLLSISGLDCLPGDSSPLTSSVISISQMFQSKWLYSDRQINRA